MLMLAFVFQRLATRKPAEAVLFGVILLGAVAGVVSLATGAIEI